MASGNYNPEMDEDDSEGYVGERSVGERSCYACGGRGWEVTCIDDLCHGQDECIHGYPPTPCRVCNPKGELEDSYL